MRLNLKRTRALSQLLALALLLGLPAAPLAAAQPPIKKQPTYKISGQAGQGTQVNLYGPATKRSTTAQSAKPAVGAYEFAGVAAGTYTVRPWQQGCNFDPAERTVTVTNADVTGVNFGVTCPPSGGPEPKKK